MKSVLYRYFFNVFGCVWKYKYSIICFFLFMMKDAIKEGEYVYDVDGSAYLYETMPRHN